jgi:hypothetical protein
VRDFLRSAGLCQVAECFILGWQSNGAKALNGSRIA